MKNVFCDVCGSAYPETESNCPVCGSSREFAIEEAFLDSGLMTEDDFYQESPISTKKPKEIFDYDEVNPEPEMAAEEPEFYDEEEYERGSSNVVLVVILLILIVLLLATAGFLYLRFFLPNMKSESAPTVPVVTTVATEAPTETTVETGIPCTDIVMEGGRIELGKDGKWLLNVKVYPSDTTDSLSYTSENEQIAIVSDSGTVTAVSEGETAVIISCGEKQIRCAVLVDYSIAEEVSQEGTLPTMAAETDETEGETEEATEPEETEETSGETVEETEEASGEDKDTSGQTLKLKINDITIFSNYTSVRLELDCDIAPEAISWYTVDSSVAICHDGVVTSTGSGITRIIGEYKGQQVECIIRCNF